MIPSYNIVQYRYYINNNEDPPRKSFVHPLGPLAIPVSSSSKGSMSFAQQLYASSFGNATSPIIQLPPRTVSQSATAAEAVRPVYNITAENGCPLAPPSPLAAPQSMHPIRVQESAVAQAGIQPQQECNPTPQYTDFNAGSDFGLTGFDRPASSSVRPDSSHPPLPEASPLHNHPLPQVQTQPLRLDVENPLPQYSVEEGSILNEVRDSRSSPSSCAAPLPRSPSPQILSTDEGNIQDDHLSQRHNSLPRYSSMDESFTADVDQQQRLFASTLTEHENERVELEQNSGLPSYSLLSEIEPAESPIVGDSQRPQVSISPPPISSPGGEANSTSTSPSSPVRNATSVPISGPRSMQRGAGSDRSVPQSARRVSGPRIQPPPLSAFNEMSPQVLAGPNDMPGADRVLRSLPPTRTEAQERRPASLVMTATSSHLTPSPGMATAQPIAASASSMMPRGPDSTIPAAQPPPSHSGNAQYTNSPPFTSPSTPGSQHTHSSSLSFSPTSFTSPTTQTGSVNAAPPVHPQQLRRRSGIASPPALPQRAPGPNTITGITAPSGPRVRAPSAPVTTRPAPTIPSRVSVNQAMASATGQYAQPPPPLPQRGVLTQPSSPLPYNALSNTQQNPARPQMQLSPGVSMPMAYQPSGQQPGAQSPPILPPRSGSAPGVGGFVIPGAGAGTSTASPSIANPAQVPSPIAQGVQNQAGQPLSPLGAINAQRMGPVSGPTHPPMQTRAPVQNQPAQQGRQRDRGFGLNLGGSGGSNFLRNGLIGGALGLAGAATLNTLVNGNATQPIIGADTISNLVSGVASLMTGSNESSSSSGDPGNTSTFDTSDSGGTFDSTGALSGGSFGNDFAVDPSSYGNDFAVDPNSFGNTNDFGDNNSTVQPSDFSSDPSNYGSNDDSNGFNATQYYEDELSQINQMDQQIQQQEQQTYQQEMQTYQNQMNKIEQQVQQQQQQQQKIYQNEMNRLQQTLEQQAKIQQQVQAQQMHAYEEQMQSFQQQMMQQQNKLDQQTQDQQQKIFHQVLQAQTQSAQAFGAEYQKILQQQMQAYQTQAAGSPGVGGVSTPGQPPSQTGQSQGAGPFQRPPGSGSAASYYGSQNQAHHPNSPQHANSFSGNQSIGGQHMGNPVHGNTGNPSYHQGVAHPQHPGNQHTTPHHASTMPAHFNNPGPSNSNIPTGQHHILPGHQPHNAGPGVQHHPTGYVPTQMTGTSHQQYPHQYPQQVPAQQQSSSGFHLSPEMKDKFGKMAMTGAVKLGGALLGNILNNNNANNNNNNLYTGYTGYTS